MEAVDLSALARQSVAAIAPLAFRSGHSIEVVDATRPVIVRGQSPFIARALAALVENAVKHTPAGTAIVVGVDDNGRLSVMDDGPGIAPADQESVFRRFWRRDRRSHGNAGLGLAIVQRVAQAHGAPVTLESRPGRTVFTVRFDPTAGR